MRPSGLELFEPGQLSLTRDVPGPVPSLRQSSRPSNPQATKYKVSSTFVRRMGSELMVPGTISLTSWVPAVLPSLFQSSAPPVLSDKEKNTVSSIFANGSKELSEAP